MIDQIGAIRRFKLQMKAATVDIGQVAGTYDLFTGTTQNVIIESLTIRMSGGAGGGNLVSISIQTNDTTPQVLIPVTLVAALTDQSQFGWTGVTLLATGKKVQITLAGGAATGAVVCDVIAEYRAVTSGGYLS